MEFAQLISLSWRNRTDVLESLVKSTRKTSAAWKLTGLKHGETSHVGDYRLAVAIVVTAIFPCRRERKHNTGVGWMEEKKKGRARIRRRGIKFFKTDKTRLCWWRFASGLKTDKRLAFKCKSHRGIVLGTSSVGSVIVEVAPRTSYASTRQKRALYERSWVKRLSRRFVDLRRL